MTVSTSVDHNDYTGNGVTTSFPYTFRIFKKTDLAVLVVDLNENITELVLDTDYSVTNAGGYNGGDVVLTSPLATGWQISIARQLEPTQETDLRNQGKFFAEVHEDAFDKLTMLIQQTFGGLRLALRRPSLPVNFYDALGFYIRNLRDPSQPQDAATRNYVDNTYSYLLGLVGTALDTINNGLYGYNTKKSFELGNTLKYQNDVLLKESSGEYYRWDGALPKSVPANSTPETTGGIGSGKWLSVGDAALRSDLSGPNAGMSGVVTRGHMLSKLVNDTSLSIGQSFRCIDRADGIFDVVDINSGQPNGFNLVAHNSLQVALKLRINGRTVDIEQMGAKPDGSEDILPILNAVTQMFVSKTGDAYDAGCTILLKENIYLLSSWTMPSIFQNLSLVGNGAKIKCKASGTYPHLIKTGWNFQNISGVDIDGVLNENYECILNINNGYGRYENITIRNAKLPIRVGLPGTNPVSLSEFYFDRLVITGCARIAECIGLYSVLQISDSVLASGEGAKWKSYDCTGLATYGGRIFVNKCTMNSNIVTTDSPYIFVSSTVEQGNTYCGQISVEQSDLEMRSRTILVSDQSTNFQNTQQNIRLSNSRVSVWLSEEPRAKTFFESNAAYRGLFSVTNCDVIFNQPLTERPIKAGIRTLCKLDYSSFNDVGYYGSNLIEWNGLPPIEEFSLKMKASITNNQSLAVGQNKIAYDQTLKDIYGTDLTLNKKFNVGLNRFECPNGEIVSVELIVNYLFSAAVTSPVEWRIDVFFSGSSTNTTICKHTTPTGVTTGSFCVALPMIDQDSTITVYATTNAAATLVGGNVFNNTISLLCKTKRPRVMS